MKLKLSEILTLNQVLKAIIDDPTKKIDSLFKFKLLGIMKSLETHVANFELIKNEKIKEYGKEAEDGNFSISKDDKESMKKFTEELNKIVYSEVSVTIEKLKAKEVFDSGVPAEYLVGLYGIIAE